MNKKGFTIIELLITAALFVTASLGFVYLLKSGAANLDSAASLTQAAYTIQAEAERIRTLPFAELADIDGDVFAGGSGRISTSPVLSDLMQIELEFAWDHKRLPLRVYTLRSIY